MDTKIIINWLLVLGYVILNSFGALAIKSSLNKLGAIKFKSFSSVLFFFMELFKSPLAIIGFFAIFISAFTWMAALSRMEISLAYPAATSLNFLIVVTIGLFLFSETLTLNKIIGIILILISLFLLSK